MVIVIRTGKKKTTRNCCVCWRDYDIDSVYCGRVLMVDTFHICPDCAMKKSIEDKVMGMIKFYRENPDKQPRWRDKIIAKFRDDSFSHVVVTAWKKAHESLDAGKVGVKVSKKRDKFLSIKVF